MSPPLRGKREREREQLGEGERERERDQGGVARRHANMVVGSVPRLIRDPAQVRLLGLHGPVWELCADGDVAACAVRADEPCRTGGNEGGANVARARTPMYARAVERPHCVVEAFGVQVQ